ncbi:Uncharacterized protein PECH_005935 [Penicillium ucsense]|uniref:NlpC/P60 domain-containing protein n=1 Tax=Penicillium ucsense TaxID=2839758 RepID=A0A8J8W7M5_9EURO|nr:Uncharacterized protein PECM_002137 [Penicillium ucsense]KAF7738280.1 Uncharacterized protein PECH_005935 [Penicillium ucsense]
MIFTSRLAFSVAGLQLAVKAYPVKTDDLHCCSACQVPDIEVSGEEIWDKTSGGCYVSDDYVKTGTSGRGSSSGSGYGSGAAIVAAPEKEKNLSYAYGSQGRRIPWAQAQKVGLFFWGENGNCATGVAHVGIFIRDGLMINAAHTGTPLREQSFWTSSGGQSICPYAMRYV